MTATLDFPTDCDAVQAVDLLIREGIRKEASDIHVEPETLGVRISLRLDGVLYDCGRLPSHLGPSLVARIKVLSNLLTYRTDIPQDGRIDKSDSDGGVDLRVSTFPTIHGENAIIRIFDPARATFRLADLGFEDTLRRRMEESVLRSHGAVFLTGPSGSGKTTTIYALLTLLAEGARRRHVVTVEDPVEVAVPGITQTQVNPAVGLTFARSLRALLRQDPEVIMVGEVRDRETAAIAIEAGLTGHLVISTVHSGRACGVFNRLIEMEIEPFLLVSSVTAVLAQRLVRRLCSCKVEKKAGEGLAQILCLAGETIYSPQGCDTCSGTGYAGRVPLAEFLPVGEGVKKVILERCDTSALEKAAVKAGMKTLLESGVERVRQGITSIAEIARALDLSEDGGEKP